MHLNTQHDITIYVILNRKIQSNVNVIQKSFIFHILLKQCEKNCNFS